MLAQASSASPSAALAQQGKSVAIIEQETAPGLHTSSRNSGVIHAGLYYPTGSMKARMCVRGKQLLYDYCQKHAIPHRRCGKLVLAAHDSQRTALQSLQQQAIENGVTDLVWLEPSELASYGKGLSAAAALFSPSTGIVDSGALLERLALDFQQAGGILACGNRLTCAASTGNGFEVEMDTAGAPAKLVCQQLINSAGLQAADVAKRIAGLHAEFIPEIRLAKGSYFSVTPAPDSDHLVYPLPEQDGLGIHLTLGMDGTTRLGPDVTWTDRIEYSVDANRAREFAKQTAHYWPAVSQARLQPDYAGIRSKCYFNDLPQRDFIIQTQDTHGVAGLINLLGIESPGLTSALALAEQLAAKVPT